MIQGMHVLDAHIHYALPVPIKDLIDVMDQTGTDQANLVIVPNRERVSSVPDALMAKAQYPDRFYVFASLDVSAYFRAAKHLGAAMKKYTQSMLRCGCDGIKIIEGKPAMRKELPVPDFDDPVWEPFFAYAETEKVPILWHVNDPETFWDETKAPSWAVEKGWCYDESYINNEAQYTQVLNLLKRHPKLKIIFAHFFFMSAQLPRLSSIMDQFPNIMIDTTPGIELYENLSLDQEGAKAFFEKYGSRIVYGTDIGARAVIPGSASEELNVEECIHRAELAQSFLTEDDPIRVKADGNFLVGNEDFELNALGLPKEMAQQILSENFLRFIGGKPKKVNAGEILKYLRFLRILIRVMGMMDKKIRTDMSVLDSIRKFFKSYKKSN